MKKENSTLSKRLKQYSALAGSMAVAGVAHGQVMYNDIPDTVFTAMNVYPGDTLALDLNNDGIADFNFVAWKNTSSTSYFAFGLIMHPYTASNPNSIEGSVTTAGVKLFGKVSELALHDNVSSNQPFFNFGSMLNATSSFNYPILLSVSYGIVKAGFWQPGETDHYAGLKFSDVTGAHYGWVRIDVDSTVSSITIKDYAYNQTPDAPLFAGQGSPLGVSEANQPSNFNILAYEGVATIFVNEGKIEDCTVTVTNMLGETIIRQPLSNRTTRIDLNQYATGIYLISVQRGNEIFSRKISFR